MFFHFPFISSFANNLINLIKASNHYFSPNSIQSLTHCWDQSVRLWLSRTLFIRSRPLFSCAGTVCGTAPSPISRCINPWACPATWILLLHETSLISAAIQPLCSWPALSPFLKTKTQTLIWGTRLDYSCPTLSVLSSFLVLPFFTPKKPWDLF